MTQAHIINNRPRLSGFANHRGARYTGCPSCGRALSIAEVIERHCENCGRQTNPEEMRQPCRSPDPTASLLPDGYRSPASLPSLGDAGISRTRLVAAIGQQP
ncbi:hypothetical protein Kim5_CH01152 [Rhizobium sp. Kim5]|nr:hypothetical protein Kim5_CH01152 [Rhizobium sp. Kim5]